MRRRSITKEKTSERRVHKTVEGWAKTRFLGEWLLCGRKGAGGAPVAIIATTQPFSRFRFLILGTIGKTLFRIAIPYNGEKPSRRGAPFRASREKVRWRGADPRVMSVDRQKVDFPTIEPGVGGS